MVGMNLFFLRKWLKMYFIPVKTQLPFIAIKPQVANLLMRGYSNIEDCKVNFSYKKRIKLNLNSLILFFRKRTKSIPFQHF